MNGTGSSSSSSSATPNFDNLLLQSLMSRFQPTRPLTPNNNKSLDQLFSDLLLNLSESDSEYDNNDDEENDFSAYPAKTQLAKEESRLEKEIVKTILSGDIEKLKPNSGQAIAIGEHHICVGFQDENGSDYRVWEWHGHIMLFDDENGYTPEYIYGNYFESIGAVKRGVVNVSKREEEEKKKTKKVEEKVGNGGLKELFESGEKMGSGSSGHVLHRILNANCGSV